MTVNVLHWQIWENVATTAATDDDVSRLIDSSFCLKEADAAFTYSLFFLSALI